MRPIHFHGMIIDISPGTMITLAMMQYHRDSTARFRETITFPERANVNSPMLMQKKQL